MHNIDAMWEMNAAHHKELLKVAKNHRSSARVRELPFQPMVRAMQLFADTLIVLGLRLKARYTPGVNKIA